MGSSDMRDGVVLVENPTDEEFREVRKTLITGTDVGVLMGLSSFNSRYGLALEKRGRVPPKEENEAMWLGKVSEPNILRAFERKMNRSPRPNRSIYINRDRTWMGATPDAFLFDPEEGLEAKLVGLGGAYDWGEPGTEEVPLAYWAQCMWYMAVTGLDVWWLIAQIGTKTQIHPIHRDNAMITRMIEAADEFRSRFLLADELPEPTGDDLDTLAKQFPVSTEGIIEETPEIRALAEALAEAKSKKAAVDAAVADARAKLEAVIQDKERIKGSNFTISWKSSKEKKVVDWEEVVVDAIEKLPQKYSTKVQKLVLARTRTVPGPRFFRTSGPLFKDE